MSKRKATTLLGVFFILLVFCTYFSATFESLLAAKVTLFTPVSRVLENYSFANCVIPECALVLENELFIAVEGEDIWGTVMTAKPVTVAVEDLGDGQVSVVDGLVGNEKVIISWDRPLDVGMRVIEQ